MNLKLKKKKKIKRTDGNYDCIVGLSGGTDSSYVIYKLWKTWAKSTCYTYGQWMEFTYFKFKYKQNFVKNKL